VKIRMTAKHECFMWGPNYLVRVLYVKDVLAYGRAVLLCLSFVGNP
jgi:hypothetical protein